MFDLNDPEKKRRREEEEAHRLRDIQPKEVSLVDRAANRKRFLLVKRSEPMNPLSLAEVQEIGDDIFSIVEEEETTDSSGASSASLEEQASQEEAAPVEKATMIPKPVQATVVKVLTESADRLQSVLERAKAAESTDEKVPTPVPSEIMMEVDAIRKLLGTLAEKYPSPRAEKTEKAGRRMSAARVKQLKDALTLLSKLLEDVRPKEEKEEKAAPPAAFEHFAALLKGQETLAEAIQKLGVGLVAQEQRIQKMEALEVTPQSRGSESTKKEVRKNKDEVHWSLDLNKPVTPDLAPKDANFWEV